MGADSISSDTLLLLLETVNKQASQIKRLEAIVSGDTFTCDVSAHKNGGDRTGKQVQQLQQMQTSLQALEQQHAASSSSTRCLAAHLHKMEQRVQQLEAQGQVLQQQGQQLQQQLGSPAPKTGMQGQHRLSSGSYVSVLAGGSSAADDVAAVHGAQHAGMPGGRSMAARLSKLEQQVDGLSATAANTEEKLLSASSSVQLLDEEVSKQLHNIRADVKQAITMATKSVRADLEAAAHARRQEDTTQLKEQLRSLTSELDSLVANSQRTLIVNLSADVERRATAAQEASDGRLAALRAQLDRLEEEKADITLVTQYTGQVADVFEQLATTVADSTQASIAQLMTQQQELRNTMTSLSASKADGSNLLQHQQHCQQQLLELQRGLAAAQAAASEAAVAAAVAKTALEPMDGLRLQLAETQGTVAALQATAAGLEAATNNSNSEQQQQAQQLQQLASSQHMLQQQLMALTNHVDPAAAAQLAAAAAGDESALTFQPLGPLASGCGSLLSNPVFESLNGGNGSIWEEAWASGSYLQCSQTGGSNGASAPGASSAAHTSAGGSTAQHAGDSQPGAGMRGAAAGEQMPPAAADAAGASGSGAGFIGASSNGGSTPGTRAAAAGRGFADRMSAVLRHLPVAVRLLRLETAVRDLHNAMVQKAPSGEMQALQQQLESFSERLVDGLTQLEGVSSSSMRHLQEESATLAEAVAALGDSLDDRPTHAQVAAKHDALQQQMGGLTAELDAVKARLRGAGQDLQHLKDWQAQACKQMEVLQGAEQQVRQQVSADLSRQQQEVQQLLAQHSAEVARDSIKQLRADQEASQGGAEAAARVVSLESKLKVVVAEVDRVQEQATLTARLQDKHTDMMAALEAALSAQSSKYATVSQQLRRELKEALAKASQAQCAKTAALESSLKDQSEALADLAAAVPELPSKGGLLEAALKSAKASLEELLAKHKKQEEGRWEVWLAEFARAIEQRPTTTQLQKQLQAVQEAAESSAYEAASQRIQCVAAAVEAGLRQQLRVVQQQLDQLCDRTQTLEQGTGIGEGYADAFDTVAAGPDSPSRMQLLAVSRKQGKGVPADDTATPAALDASAQSRAAAADDAARQAAAQAEADAEAHRVSVAAIVAAFEGSPAPASTRTAARTAGNAAASPADVQSLLAAAASPVVPQWRELPLASSVLAEATGAAAAAAAASPCMDSSVAARNEGDSGSDPTVEGSSSVDSSCEGDSNIHAAVAAAKQRALPHRQHTPAAAAAAVAASPQPALSVESSASRPFDARAEATALLQELQWAACTNATAQESVIEAADDAASPSVRSLSPEVLQALTPLSKPRRAAAAEGQPGAQAAFSSPAAAGPSSSTTTPYRGAQGRPGAAQASPMQQGAAETADCTSELQQLLNLQQQVQQCLLDSGCVAVGRRAKPPKDRQSKKGHKRTRMHGSAAGAVAADSAAAAAAAGDAGGDAAAELGGGVLSVDAAIAAAATAMADRLRVPAAAEASPGPRQQQHHSHHSQQQQQQQEALVAASQEVAAAAAQPAAAAPVGRPSRSQEIRSLLSLQQQLAQCLKDHGCFLEQQRQQQAPPEPFMSSPGGSSIAGLQQQQQQQQQRGQEVQQQGQRYNVQEVELEQLLVLQAQMQMQQAVQHQGQ